MRGRRDRRVPRAAHDADDTDHDTRRRSRAGGDRARAAVHGLVVSVFPYAVDKRFVAIWALFGCRPSQDGVTLTDDGRLVATYGFTRLETLLDNVDGAHITRGYRWWKAIGVRGSFVDDGLTFGTNTDGGVCIHFREKVKGPMRRSWSALTVTVADLDGLVAALGVHRA